MKKYYKTYYIKHIIKHICYNWNWRFLIIKAPLCDANEIK